jgi:polysaccharide export outer membrane protein
VEVTPILVARAPSCVFVVGEVRNPGRYDLRGPTTAMQSLALAGGWKQKGNLRQIVVFRRAEDWRLLATKIDVQGGLDGTCPSPADEIWLRDSDLVVVPRSASHWCDETLGHLFGRRDCSVGRHSMIGE